MKFKDLSVSDRMDWACRYLIIHSIIYYELNENIISDKDFDTKLKWLCEYVKSNPDKIETCQYKDVLLNIDPSTGFNMKNHISAEHHIYLTTLARNIIKQYKRGE